MDQSLQARAKVKINKWDYIQLKSFCTTKETIKNLEEKAGNNLFNLSYSNFLLNTSLKARELKPKMNYWGLIKIKGFCTAKETINTTKRQPTEWEKIFGNDISDKRLVCKIYKELTKLHT